MESSQPADQPAALIEGRRIYLGNLLYIAQPVEIEEMLKANGFSQYEKIHISVDPVSARNPGYCFVDFLNRDDADRALASLVTEIRGRPVKVGPCEPKQQRRRGRWNSEQEPTFQRWGNWTGQRRPIGGADAATPIGKVDNRGAEQGPYGAIDHFDDVAATDGDGRRLYVGGLAKMIDQQHNDDEIRDIFASAGFYPAAIGKRITPHESTRAKAGNHHYCFVDFTTVEEAAAATQALDGRARNGVRLRIKVANPIPENIRVRTRTSDSHGGWHSRPSPGRPAGGNRPDWPASQDASVNEQQRQQSGGKRSSCRRPDPGISTSKSALPSRSLASRNWRQKDPVS